MRMEEAGERVGGFALVRLLKAHGETRVWNAVREADGAEVALKLAPAGSSAAVRLRHEESALSRVMSRSTVAVAGSGELDGRVFLALDWYRGGTLKERLAADGSLSVSAVGAVARMLLGALRDVHAAGIIHRDLKPGNVFLTEFGDPRLGDFGIALLPGERPKPGAVVGSAAYMSPEQAAGRRVDARSDLYSLGLVLHELTTGRQVFAGASFAEKLRRAATEAAPFLSEVAPDVPVSFARFVATLTARDRALRPRSAVEAFYALKAMIF